MHDLFPEANKLTQFENKINCAINSIVTINNWNCYIVNISIQH